MICSGTLIFKNHRFRSDITTLGAGVDGTVRRISRTYEVRGGLRHVTSYDAAAVGSGSVVNDVLLSYDGFGQLAADYQAHAGTVNMASTPKVAYAYADGSANTVRRTSLTYPSGRVIAYVYGTAGSLADRLSRLAYPEPGVQLRLPG